jgi:hypothetical protein
MSACNVPLVKQVSQAHLLAPTASLAHSVTLQVLLLAHHAQEIHSSLPLVQSFVSHVESLSKARLDHQCAPHVHLAHSLTVLQTHHASHVQRVSQALRHRLAAPTARLDTSQILNGRHHANHVLQVRMGHLKVRINVSYVHQEHSLHRQHQHHAPHAHQVNSAKQVRQSAQSVP